MAKKTSTAAKVRDGLENLFTNQAGRAGISAERVHTALTKGIPPEALAIILSSNSKKNNPQAPVTFTAGEIEGVAKFYSANRTRAIFPKSELKALAAVQEAASLPDASASQPA